jgi:hypothetical protein
MISICLQDWFDLTPESAAAKVKLAPRIEAHNAEVDRLAGDERELSAVMNEDWTPSHRTAAAKIKNRKGELLREEVELRREINAHLDRVIGVDTVAARTAASTEFEAAKTEVASKLEAIGYVAPDFGIVSQHPKVSKARLRLDGFAGGALRDGRTANLGRLEKAEAQIADLRKRDLAV